MALRAGGEAGAKRLRASIAGAAPASGTRGGNPLPLCWSFWAQHGGSGELFVLGCVGFF